MQTQVKALKEQLQLVQASAFDQLDPNCKVKIEEKLKSLEPRICLEAMINHRAGTP